MNVSAISTYNRPNYAQMRNAKINQNSHKKSLMAEQGQSNVMFTGKTSSQICGGLIGVAVGGIIGAIYSGMIALGVQDLPDSPPCKSLCYILAGLFSLATIVNGGLIGIALGEDSYNEKEREKEAEKAKLNQSNLNIKC